MNSGRPDQNYSHLPRLVLLVPEGQQVSAALLGRLGKRLRLSGWPLQISFRVDPRRMHGCSYLLRGRLTGNRSEFHVLLISLFCEFASTAETQGDAPDA